MANLQFVINLWIYLLLLYPKEAKFWEFDSPKHLKRPNETAVLLWKPLPNGRCFDLGEAYTKARPVTHCRRVHEVYQKASAFSKLAWCLKPQNRGLTRGYPLFAFWYFWAVKSAKQFAKLKKSQITKNALFSTFLKRLKRAAFSAFFFFFQKLTPPFAAPFIPGYYVHIYFAAKQKDDHTAIHPQHNKHNCSKTAVKVGIIRKILNVI